jgi:diguanylate cyclase (GGDEF)-like protein
VTEAREWQSEPGRVEALHRLRNELRRPSDSILDDAAESGELLVAEIRALVSSGLLLLQFFPAEDPGERWVGRVLAAVSLVFSLGILALVRRRYERWQSFASSAFDVTLVTAALAAFVLLDRPHTAVNSRVVFLLYFLAVAVASIRYNWRLCVFTGLLAVAQYATLVGWTAARFDLASPVYAPFEYGVFSWSDQVGRLLVLLAACVVSTASVLRAQRLRRLSTIDGLTGMLNRRAADDRLAEELSRAGRNRRPLSVAIVDLDHFKRVNDTYGHAEGDVALVSVARTLRNSLRKSDVVARYGGEEFLVLMPESDAASAVAKLEALRRAIEESPLRPAGSNGPVTLTATIGVSSFPTDGTTVDAIIERADLRLYEAKRRGRNRVLGPKGSPA